MKRCAKCKDLFDALEFNKDSSKRDGLCSWCRECKKVFGNNGNGPKHGPRKNRTSNIITYRVIYDPCDSFSLCSEFTRVEIYEMLKEEYLAIGTTFLRKRDKTYHKVTEEMKFERVAA
jgi:hypothetical protein